MSFPDRTYPSAGAYIAAYRDESARAWASVDLAAVDRAAALLDDAIRAGRTVYACGNGGSAAISGHLLCDFLKGIQTDTALRPKIVSLASHLELITAIANDIDYAEIFAYQLRTLAQPGDVLMTISSSGNSENIVRAIDWARGHDVKSIAMTGFSGGRSKALADVVLHVAAENYGVVEDIHQSMMHSLAQYLRQRAMAPEHVPGRPF
ncbi:MAG: SIS domain-containing protein [Alphaproteobacteria bacterium]|nr:SIS domain-containing protein [Alphaproteobacteria bacterium]MBV9551658.1 SIS domain-containing protein [Alphaproteobacteria bacterium]